MLALYCPFGVQGTSSSSQLDKYQHWHDDQCSLVTFADQPINRKQKYLFHRDPPCFENKRSAQQDWKWEKNDWTFTMSTLIPTHQRAKVRQRSSLVCSSLQVFSRCNSIFPGVILALLLHGLFSFNYVHCKLDLLLAPTARQSDRHRRARGLAGFSRWRSTEQRCSWNCGAPSASAQRSTGSFPCDWKRKMWRKLSVGRTWKRAKRLLAWQGSRWRRAQTRMRRSWHRWAKRPRPDVLWSPIHWPKTNQWSPVGIIIRN